MPPGAHVATTQDEAAVVAEPARTPTGEPVVRTPVAASADRR